MPYSVQAELPGFASVNKQFAEACLLLTRQLLRLLSLTLKQKEGCLEEMLQDPFVALHNLHYAPVVSEPEKGIVGLGQRCQYPNIAHTAEHHTPSLVERLHHV